jgi:hypothetical protein
MTRPAQAERCFSSHSPTLRPWIARVRVTPASYVEGHWSPSLRRSFRKIDRLKQTLFAGRFFARGRRGSFSLRRGLESI